MTLERLKELIASKQFHHATYRDSAGGLFEGLHIYVRDPEGFRGYRHEGAFFKDSPELKAAEELVAGTAISVGAYGEG